MIPTTVKVREAACRLSPGPRVGIQDVALPLPPRVEQIISERQRIRDIPSHRSGRRCSWRPDRATSRSGRAAYGTPPLSGAVAVWGGSGGGHQHGSLERWNTQATRSCRARPVPPAFPGCGFSPCWLRCSTGHFSRSRSTWAGSQARTCSLFARSAWPEPPSKTS